MAAPAISPVVFGRGAVEDALRAYCPKMRPYELDGKYYALTRDEWATVINDIGPEHNKYVAERFDCDAFSRVWYGKVAERFEVNSMFIVVDFSGRHSYNLLLEHDGKGNLSCSLFEPQTLMHPVKGSGHYTMTDGFLL